MSQMFQARQAVEQLLEQYHHYQQLTDQLDQLRHRLVKQRLAGQATDQLRRAIAAARAQQQQVSDAMTFDTPLIWVMYKYQAYQGQSQPISTLHDLRLHCATPGYICTKRWQFVNEWRQVHDLPPLTDVTIYPDDLALPVLYDELLRCQQDAACMTAWRQYEYHRTRDGAVAKWANWSER